MKGVNEMNIAGILAGGIGSRMGSTLPKQFLEIGGVPIIIRVINRFINNENIDYAIIAMNSEWMDYCKEMLKKWEIDIEKIALIEGGETRFESLYNIAKKAYEYNNESVVISHDCARVFVSDAIINNNIELTILDIKGDQVKIGISAPKDVSIYRKEVYLQIQEANKEAMSGNDLDVLNAFLK